MRGWKSTPNKGLRYTQTISTKNMLKSKSLLVLFMIALYKFRVRVFQTLFVVSPTLVRGVVLFFIIKYSGPLFITKDSGACIGMNLIYITHAYLVFSYACEFKTQFYFGLQFFSIFIIFELL